MAQRAMLESVKELADRLASTADITSGLQLGTEEMFRGLRNMNRPEYQSIDHLRKEEGRKQVADIPLSEVGNDLC